MDIQYRVHVFICKQYVHALMCVCVCVHFVQSVQSVHSAVHLSSILFNTIPTFCLLVFLSF